MQRQVYVVEVAECIGLVRKHHNKLFIVKLDMLVVFVFSQKNFNLILKVGRAGDFVPQRNKVDHFDRNVHNFH